MYSGTEITGLHLVREGDQYYTSFESWCFCVGSFRKLKYGFNLELNIPIVTDERTVKFLDGHAWHDWVAKELATTQINIFSKDKEVVPHEPDSETIETLAFLDRLFPEKKKIFFYELNSIVSTWCHGSFRSFDKNGNIEPFSDHALKQIGYYNNKYYGKLNNDEVIEYPEEVKKLKDAYFAEIRIPETEKNEKIQTAAYEKYRKANDKFLNEHHSLLDVFITIGEHVVVCPYAYTHATVKGCEYEHAGDIYMVVTPDTVYFQSERHF
jgi:hypothetical protein